MTWIRRIAAVSILIVSIAIWLYFFLTVTGISIIRFYLVTNVIPLGLASFYISTLVWSKSKQVSVAMVIPAIIASIYASSLFTDTRLSTSRLLIEPILIPAIFVSFYIAILLWERSKLMSVVMLIPTIATAVYVSFFLPTTSLMEISASRYLAVTSLIPILFALFYMTPKNLAAKGWILAIKKVFLWSILSTAIFIAFLVTAWFAGLNTIFTPDPTQPMAGAIGLAIAIIGTIIYAILAYATILRTTTESIREKNKKP